MPSEYPTSPRDRDRWVLARRGARHAVDSGKPYAFLAEQEATETGPARTATIFLTNRECPWRCLMCDLWKNTLTETVSVGAIPAQIDFALAALESRGQGAGGRGQGFKIIKLYNSGSFFDPRAIPPEDYEAIAERVCRFRRVVVESHPALVGSRCLDFKSYLEQAAARAGCPSPALEVAMGLETAHPETLAKLNKRMTLPQFAQAADFLAAHRFSLRAFVLVKPPFMDEAMALEWAKLSLDFAFDCGTRLVSLIPVRLGNGALDALAATGQFAPPQLAILEAAAEYGWRLGRGLVQADLWDLQLFSNCPDCFERRRKRLQQMNLIQAVLPRVNCGQCFNRD